MSLENKHREIFFKIITNKEFQENILWGKPRNGHPEGSVASHIFLLEYGLSQLRELLPLQVGYYNWKIKILIYIHDSFKMKSEKRVNIHSEKNHANLAAQFYKTLYPEDKEIYNMILYHDEGYNCWKAFQRGDKYESRLLELFQTIQDWNLFLLFCILDSTTPGKSNEPILWLIDRLKEWLPSNSQIIRPEMIAFVKASTIAGEMNHA